jgi:hypothetical protein
MTLSGLPHHALTMALPTHMNYALRFLSSSSVPGTRLFRRDGTLTVERCCIANPDVDRTVISHCRIIAGFRCETNWI